MRAIFLHICQFISFRIPLYNRVDATFSNKRWKMSGSCLEYRITIIIVHCIFLSFFLVWTTQCIHNNFVPGYMNCSLPVFHMFDLEMFKYLILVYCRYCCIYFLDSRFKIQDVYCSKHKICARNILQIIDYTTDKHIIAISQKHYKLDINTLTYSASLAKSSSLQLLNNENNLNTDIGLL